MSSLYGVANPNPPWNYATIIGAGDVACPAGVETNVVAVPLLQPSIPGAYYPVMFATLTIDTGATPVTGVQIATRIGAGSDLIQIGWPAWAWTATTFSTQNLFLPGTSGVVQNPAAGIILNISLAPAGAAITAKNFWCYAFARWERAFD